MSECYLPWPIPPEEKQEGLVDLLEDKRSKRRTRFLFNLSSLSIRLLQGDVSPCAKLSSTLLQGKDPAWSKEGSEDKQSCQRPINRGLDYTLMNRHVGKKNIGWGPKEHSSDLSIHLTYISV